MAKCKNCGAELFDSSKFCPECGTPVETAPDPEKTAEILEAEAENILEDIPEIKKIEGTEEHKPAKKPLPKPPEFLTNPDAKPLPKAETPLPEIKPLPKAEAPLPEIKPLPKPVTPPPEEKKAPEAPPAPPKEQETEYDPTYENDPGKFKAEKKKSPAGAIIAVVAVCAAVFAGLFFTGVIGGGNSPPEETAAETTLTDPLPEEPEPETETETEAPPEPEPPEESETIPEPPAETEAETTEQQTEESETEAAPEEETAAESNKNGIVELTPEHSQAMGTGISTELVLSENGITLRDFAGGEIRAFYTTPAAGLGGAPAVMIINFEDGNTEIEASSYNEEYTVFDYVDIAAGTTMTAHIIEDIDSMAFRSTGAPVDITSVAFVPVNMKTSE